MTEPSLYAKRAAEAIYYQYIKPEREETLSQIQYIIDAAMSKVVADAYRRGAEEMRERCIAAIHDDDGFVALHLAAANPKSGLDIFRQRIRALPIDAAKREE